MIAEDLLERGLNTAAESYAVPEGAVDRLREQLAPAVADDEKPAWRTTPMRWRPSGRGWLAISAAAVVVLIVASFIVGGTNNPSTRSNIETAAPNSAGRTALSGANTGGPSGSVQHGPASSRLRSAQTLPAPAVAGSGTAGAPAGAATSSGTTDALTQTYGSAKNLAPVPGAPTRVVKTGELDLQVAKGRVSPTLDRVAAIATLERGYVSDSRTAEGGFDPSGEVTLRIPVQNFEDAIARARHITGAKVLALQTTGQDVTSRYVDLQARIKALKQTRATFLQLLSRATTIGETLAVQQQVTDVQTQIEQLQGQLSVLANRSALSTLTVTVDQKVLPLSGKQHHKSGLTKAIDKSVSRFVRGVEAIISIIGPVLLVLLVIAIGWLASTFGYRALRRRMV